MEQKNDKIRGSTLKKLRNERNLTQQQLADYLNLSKQAISKFEQGVPYSLDTAIAFSKFFNVELDYLIGNTRVGKLAQSVLDQIREQKEIIDAVLTHVNPRIDILEKKVKKLEEKLESFRKGN